MLFSYSLRFYAHIIANPALKESIALRFLRLLLVSMICSACSSLTPKLETASPSSVPSGSLAQNDYQVGLQALTNPNNREGIRVPNTLYDFQFLHFDPELKPFSNSNDLAQSIAGADIILFGEYHEQPALHYTQLRLLQGLHHIHPQWVLSMELFSRDQQADVDRYLKEEIGEYTLRQKTKVGGSYFSSFRGLLEFSRVNRIPVIAANAPKSVVRCIGLAGELGWDQVPEALMPFVRRPLVIDEPEYEQRFVEFMQGADAQQIKNSFAAQQVWDATMAESIIEAKKQHPEHKIIHTVGTFHIAESGGLLRRLRHLQPDLKIAVITPIDAEILASKKLLPQKQESGIFKEMFVLVKPMPAQWLPSEMASHQHHGKAKDSGDKRQKQCSF